MRMSATNKVKTRPSSCLCFINLKHMKYYFPQVFRKTFNSEKKTRKKYFWIFYERHFVNVFLFHHFYFTHSSPQTFLYFLISFFPGVKMFHPGFSVCIFWSHDSPQTCGGWVAVANLTTAWEVLKVGWRLKANNSSLPKSLRYPLKTCNVINIHYHKLSKLQKN